MTTDRELLELAAKAAGYVVLDGWDGKSLSMLDPATGMSYSEWNPLTDDGDALRLAVKLRISICHFQHDMVAAQGDKHWAESRKGDDLAPTRRAIVRAAADIERAMSS